MNSIFFKKNPAIPARRLNRTTLKVIHAFFLEKKSAEHNYISAEQEVNMKYFAFQV